MFSFGVYLWHTNTSRDSAYILYLHPHASVHFVNCPIRFKLHTAPPTNANLTFFSLCSWIIHRFIKALKKIAGNECLNRVKQIALMSRMKFLHVWLIFHWRWNLISRTLEDSIKELNYELRGLGSTSFVLRIYSSKTEVPFTLR